MDKQVSRLFLSHEIKYDRNPLHAACLFHRVHQEARIGCGDVIRVVHHDLKARWYDAGLGDVVEFQRPVSDHRRGVGICNVGHEAVEYAGGDTGRGLYEQLIDEGIKAINVLAGQRRGESQVGIGHEPE